MSKTYNSALQARVGQFLKEKGISQAKAAPMMGLSETALSQYLNSKYDKGDIAKTERKLEEFFRLQEAAQTHTEKGIPFRHSQGYIPTSISEDVYKLIKYSQLERCMVIAHGDAGIGKTKAANKFEADNPTSTIYVQASPATGSLREILRSLARELKIPDNMRNGDLVKTVRAKLEEGRKVVIIDEAQHLTYKALEEISRWADPDRHTGESHVAIVLMGNTEVYSRMCGRQEAAFACQFNRVRLPRLYRTADIQRQDVEKLFPLLVERGMEKELDFLLGISRSRWSIRGAVNVYDNAVNNENITYDGLYAMARSMGIGLV